MATPQPQQDVSKGTPAQRAVQRKLEQDQHVPSKKNVSQWLLKNLCQSTSDALSGIEQTSYSIDQYSKDLIKKTTAAYHAFSTPFNGSVSNVTNSIDGFTDKFSSTLEDASQAISEELSKALKPVPLGSVVDTATQILKNPLGSGQLLSNSLTSMVDKISPTFANQLDSAFKSIGSDNLQHLPSKVMGSVRNLTTAADSILAMPFELVSDLYNGLLDILNSIADMIDGMISSIMNFFIGPGGLLDKIFPIQELLSFFDQLGQIASMVGGLAQQFGGFEMVTNITGQISNFSSQATSALSNPLQLASSYAPQLQQGLGSVSQLTGALRDPEQALQQFLPPEIGEQMKKISQIPGLGFVGNMGFSVGDTLDTLKGGFFTKALDEFSNQLPILGPLFNQTGGANAGPPLTETMQPGPQSFQTSEINPNMQVGTGNTTQIEDTAPYQVFPEKQKDPTAKPDPYPLFSDSTRQKAKGFYSGTQKYVPDAPPVPSWKTKDSDSQKSAPANKPASLVMVPNSTLNPNVAR